MKESFFSPVVTARLSEVEPEVFRKLYQLNMRQKGRMRYTLLENKKNPNSFVCYILDENNNVAAWALIYCYHYMVHPGAHFYVRKKYRRKGLGSALTEAAIKVAQDAYEKKLNYFPWDPISQSFFKRCREWGILNKTNDSNQGYY